MQGRTHEGTGDGTHYEGTWEYEGTWNDIKDVNLNIGQALKLFAGSFGMEMNSINWDELSSLDDVASFVTDNAKKRYVPQKHKVPDQPLP